MGAETEIPPVLYDTGCAGRIAAFSEADGGQLRVALVGVCRFSLCEEIATTRGYRRCQVDFSTYQDDLSEAEIAANIDRLRLLSSLERFFSRREITPDWETLENIADFQLVTSLSMSCPFAPEEKQALLEATNLPQRTEMLISLLEMSGADPDNIARH